MHLHGMESKSKFLILSLILILILGCFNSEDNSDQNTEDSLVKKAQVHTDWPGLKRKEL